MKWRGLGAGTALLALLAVGCAEDEAPDGESADPTEATASALPVQPTGNDLAAAAECETVHDFGADDDGPAEAPLRGAAAIEGVSCTREGVEVHLFVRAPASADTTGGGTVDNIDRLVGTGSTADGCGAWVAIGDSWFALAEDQEALTAVAADLGGAVREILPTGPPASYVPPGC